MKYIKLFEAIGDHLVNDYFEDKLWRHISFDDFESILDDYKKSNRLEEIGNKEVEKLKQIVDLFLSKYKFKTNVLETHISGRYTKDDIKYQCFFKIEGFKSDQLWISFEKLTDSYWLVEIDAVIFEKTSTESQIPSDSLVMDYFLCDDVDGLEKWATEYILPKDSREPR